jgi:hypothetical protein
MVVMGRLCLGDVSRERLGGGSCCAAALGGCGGTFFAGSVLIAGPVTLTGAEFA